VPWYFAYGSNMQRATLSGRRGIAPTRAVPVRVPGWRVVFDKPSLLGLPEAYANLVADAAAHAFGVAFAISDDELAHVELTEGVAIGNYRRVEVAVEPLDVVPDPPARAYSLSSDQRDPTRRPSTRYLGVVLDGAREHGLPAHWLEWLASLDAAAESLVSQAARGLLDAVMKKRS
jgi:gamma-glutamylcyclotransferase